MKIQPDPEIPEDRTEETDEFQEVHEVVVCRIGKEAYAFPLETVSEIYRSSDITPLPSAPPFLLGVVNIHGILSSVISLSAVLHPDEPILREGLLLILTQEFGGFSLLVEGTTGFAFYSALEEVPFQEAEKEKALNFIEGVFRDNGDLIALVSPEKLRVWIDGEFTKGED